MQREVVDGVRIRRAVGGVSRQRGGEVRGGGDLGDGLRRGGGEGGRRHRRRGTGRGVRVRRERALRRGRRGRRLGWVHAVRVQEVEQHAHVLQPGVHALPVEGHHRVRGVADDHRAAAVVVRRALDADERQVRVRGELGDQVRRGDEVGAQAWEALVEEGRERGLGGGGQGGEGGGGGEQRAGEGAVERRDRDEHEGCAGPDVEVVGGDGERGVCGTWWDVEFAPERVDVLLLVVDAGELHEVVARGGVGAVGADEEIEVDFFFGVALVLGCGSG